MGNDRLKKILASLSIAGLLSGISLALPVPKALGGSS